MAGFKVAWIIGATIAVLGQLATAQSPPAATTPVYRCATTAAPQAALELNSSVVSVGEHPWGLAYLNDSIAFAAINFSIGVLDTSEFTPKLTFLFPLPPAYYIGNSVEGQEGYGFRELTLSHDKRNLYVATGYGAVIYDVPRLLASRNDSIVGVLSSNGVIGNSSIEVNLTPDDDFAFVSQEFGNNKTLDRGAIEVYNITRLDNGTVTSTWRGYIVLGYRTIAQQFSKNYTSLFVTSEISTNTTQAMNLTTGVISVLDVEKLKYTPGKSLVSQVSGGCHPARAVMSVDRNHLWVAAREANLALAFDTEILASNDPTNALSVTVSTGTSPIGLAALPNHILTADSNRWNYTNTTTGMTVINAEMALSRAQLSFPQFPTGLWPRTIVVSPDQKTALISEFGDGTIRAVDVSVLN
ncbi:hypothetical protein BX600DRAFT_100214 [Xylariales sp. PMI_506]|nr:hypothetical protein BX600DRAFT_100214 [Xylariales sp. PMI_506]